MSVFLNIVSLLGGLALFLYGMRIMGDGLKQGSSGTLKRAMEKVTNNPIIGFLLGLIVTCVIQSSTATIVITSGLVGAGIISLHQSLGIIIGANVGTTITAQIIRLLDIDSSGDSILVLFKPSTLAPIAAIIGIILIMAFKFRNSDTIGTIAIGFGILFTGLLNMTAAVSPLSESPLFSELFLNLGNIPVLGFLVGAGAALLIQSSSATVGILQALSITGQLSFHTVYPILLGIYMGDCITTAIVCSIGAKADAKRTGAIHVMYNLGKVFIIFIGVFILNSFGVFGDYWASPLTSGGIANIHTIFNIVCAVIMLPFCGLFEKLSKKIIKDDPGSEDKNLNAIIETLDKALFISPALALSASHKVINVMASLSYNGVVNAMDNLAVYDQKKVDTILRHESSIDTLADKTSDYLLRLSPYIKKDHGEDRLNYYIKCVTEFERIGDYAENITENAGVLIDKNTKFSPKAKEELKILWNALYEILEYSCNAFINHDLDAAKHIEPIEEVIDDLVADLKTEHLTRLKDGKCNVYAGNVFLDVLVNAERISDQCSNIGVHTITLFDKEAADMQHDYLRSLHQGKDEFFNAEYEKAHDKYMGALSELTK